MMTTDNEWYSPRAGRIQKGAERLPSLKGHDVYAKHYRVPDLFFIYAYLDAGRRVLYVGRTGNLRGRNAEHHQKSAWYSLATEVRVLWTTFDKAEARAAEVKAIRELAPTFNVTHNHGRVAA